MPCEHTATIKRIDRELFGNGNQGMVKQFTEQCIKFNDMNEHVEKLATSYSALAKSQIAIDATEKLKEQNKKDRNGVIQRIGTLFAIITGAVGLLYVILEHV